MLKSELNKLEKYIEEIRFNASSPGAEAISPEPEQIAAIRAECRRLKNAWVHELFRPVKESVIIRYIQYHQAGLISLSDATGGTYEIQDELEHLILFIKESFYKYFDLDHQISLNYVRQFKAKVEQFLFDGEKKSKPVFIEKSLADCIYNSVKEIIRDESLYGATYRQTDRYLYFISIFTEHLQNTSSTTTTDLAKILYKANFNSTSFFHWFRQFLEKEIKKVINPPDNNRWIDQKITELEEWQTDRILSFSAEDRSIDHVVIDWLRSQKSVTIDPVIHEIAPVPYEQMSLKFSVPQFALFIRLFQLAGCFAENNLAKIQRFFAAHFITKKQSHISLKSFGRSFYSADQTTAAIVRDALKRMLDHIDKHYFPK